MLAAFLYNSVVAFQLDREIAFHLDRIDIYIHHPAQETEELLV